MTKILPIVIENSMVETERFTFNRLAIIQASKFSEDWLASHLNIFFSCELASGLGNNPIRFGDNFKLYRPSYYQDILDMQCLNIYEIQESTIVSLIKSQIDAGKYVMTHTVVSNMLGHKEYPGVYELLIYGYDDNDNNFHVASLIERKFVPDIVPYEHIEKSLPKVKENLHGAISNPAQRVITLTTQFTPPFATYTLNDNFSTSICRYMALDKIDTERNGRQLNSYILNDNMEIDKSYACYTGVACIQGLYQMISRMLADISLLDYDPWFVGGMKRTHEHRTLILLAMEYVKKNFDINDDRVSDEIKKYSDCCKRFQKLYHMALKYELTQDKQILVRIMAELANAFKQERDALNNYKKNMIESLKRDNPYLIAKLTSKKV